MTKKLRREPIDIAPDIVGWLEENYNPIVKDKRNNQDLDPNNVDHKIIIYERQVNDWFLVPATRYTKEENDGFIVLMICMSYLEGVEQYKKGETSNGRSGRFFKSAIERIYPGKYSPEDLGNLYSEARCGLFHNGMVGGMIIINNSFNEPFKFENATTIKVNPKKLLEDIKADFEQFISQLRSDLECRTKFGEMYSNL
jgi:hypothetical protein